MDRTEDHHVERNKPNLKSQMLHIFIDMQNLDS
jgi:hypothetical protein